MDKEMVMKDVDGVSKQIAKGNMVPRLIKYKESQ